MKKNLYKLSAILMSTSILLIISWYIDSKKAQSVINQSKREILDINIVYEEFQDALSWYHPFNKYFGNTVFGESNLWKEYEKIQDRAFEENNKLFQEYSLPQTESNTSFEVFTDSISSLNKKYLAHAQDLIYAQENGTDTARTNKIRIDFLEPLLFDYSEKLAKGIDLTYEKGEKINLLENEVENALTEIFPMDAIYEVFTNESLEESLSTQNPIFEFFKKRSRIFEKEKTTPINEFFSKLKRVREKFSKKKFFERFLDKILIAYYKGKCNFVLNRLKDKEVLNIRTARKRLESLVELKEECEEYIQAKELTSQIVETANKWDYYQALEVYDAFNQGIIEEIDESLEKRFTEYIEGSIFRDSLKLEGIINQYKNHASSFFSWLDALNNTQSFNINQLLIQVPFNQKNPFISYEIREEVVGNGWESHTMNVTKFDRPYGNISLKVGRQKVINIDYRYSNVSQEPIALSINNIFQWSPNEKISLEVTNDESNRKINKAWNNTYSLFSLQKDWVFIPNENQPQVKLKLLGLELPKFEPKKLPEPRKNY